MKQYLRPTFYASLGLVLVACAMSKPETQATAADSRIVQTDLTKPHFAWQPTLQPASPVAQAAITDRVQVAELNDRSIATEQETQSASPEEVNWFTFWQRLQTEQVNKTIVADGRHIEAIETMPAKLDMPAAVTPTAEVVAVQAEVVADATPRLQGQILPTSLSVVVDKPAVKVAPTQAKAQQDNDVTLVSQSSVVPASTPSVWSTVASASDNTQAATSEATTAPVYVAFQNESTRLNKMDAGFLNLLSYASTDEHFFIVGHSHGRSSVGVATLAQKRAEAVAAALKQQGVSADRIHTMASWSTDGVDYAPLLGVQTFVVKSPNPERVLLAFSR